MKNNNMTSPFRVGQWVWTEFELSEITDMKEGRITGISTGYISMGAHDLTDRTFPTDRRAKLVSEEWASASKKLHKVGGGLNLNFPDIHRHLVSTWAETMEHRDDDEAVKDGYAKLRAFVEDVEKAVSLAKDQKLTSGLKLFRQ